MKHYLPPIIVGLGLLLFVACKPRVPSGILSEQQMEEVLYDYHLASSIIEYNGTDSLAACKYIDAVFKKHHITPAEFDSTLKWYTRNTEVMFDVYKRINMRYADMAQVLGSVNSRASSLASIVGNGDTANIWQGNAFYMLSNQEGQNRLFFTITADSSFFPRDRYVLQWKSEYIESKTSGPKEMDVYLAVRYENDSVSSRYERVWGSGGSKLTLIAADLPIKEVLGFIYMKGDRKDPLTHLLITEPALIRFRQYKKASEQAVLSTGADSISVTLKADSTVVDSGVAGRANVITRERGQEKMPRRPRGHWK